MNCSVWVSDSALEVCSSDLYVCIKSYYQSIYTNYVCLKIWWRWLCTEFVHPKETRLWFSAFLHHWSWHTAVNFSSKMYKNISSSSKCVSTIPLFLSKLRNYSYTAVFRGSLSFLHWLRDPETSGLKSASRDEALIGSLQLLLFILSCTCRTLQAVTVPLITHPSGSSPYQIVPQGT